MSATSSHAVPAGANPTAAPVSLCEAFQSTAARRGDAPALRTPGDAVTISWSDYADRVEALAAGLAAHGVERGHTVAMMLTNRPEGHLLDTAALHLGATPFSVYNTSSPEQLEYLLHHAGSRVIVTERQFIDRVLVVREQVPSLQYVFTIEGDAVPGTADLGELAAAGDPAFDFEASWRSIGPSDVATLIYTSGTTGPPKGVELTHDNLIFDICAWLEISQLKNDGRMMSYLPMAHLADRVFGHYVSIMTGGTVTCVDDAKAAVPAIADTRPTLWLGVPRVWEKLKASLEAQFAGETDPGRRAAIAKAIAASIERVRLEQAGQPVPDELRQECEQADAAILSAVRNRLGFDADTFLLSGAAPIPLDVLEFFAALGLPINEGYGMTECSAVTTLNCPGARRYGTVGRSLPGVEVSLAEDGELLTRGRLVMPRYRKAPDKTAEAIDVDGWFHTGDVAEIDDDGFVRIVDRKKELIINAAGKNMSPANIEEKLKSASPLIGVPVAIGDARPYNTALIVLEPEAVAVFARENGIEEADVTTLASDPRVQAAVADGIEQANSRMSRVEQIKKHTILPGEWLPGGDELTPTLKLKRKPIAAKYTAEIEAMYAR